ncbi:zinc finger, CCHC-type containing protein [Tanacetum coccineum]
MDSIMGNNTLVLADLPLGCKPIGCKWIFKRKLRVFGTIEKFEARLVIQGFRQESRIYYFDTYAPVTRISTMKLLIALSSIHNLIIQQMDMKTSFLNGGSDNEFLSSKFSVKDMGEDNVILLSIPMDTSEKMIPNNGQAISQLEYSRMIGCLMYAMNCTRLDIAFTLGKLSSWINNTEDNSSTSSWVFQLGREAAGKEAKCVAILAKAYSQMHNGKFSHLDVRYNMIRELITNEVVEMPFSRL